MASLCRHSKPVTLDVRGLAEYVSGATIQLMASPFVWLVRRERPDL